MKSDDELLGIILEMADIQADLVVSCPEDYFKNDDRINDKEYVRLVKLCSGVSFTVSLNREE